MEIKLRSLKQCITTVFEWVEFNLSDQLLNDFSFLRKSTKWSRKLLIHLINLVILNAYILNRHYGLQRMTQDEYRDYLVKYLLHKGLKCYKISLPPF